MVPGGVRVRASAWIPDAAVGWGNDDVLSGADDDIPFWIARLRSPAPPWHRDAARRPAHPCIGWLSAPRVTDALSVDRPGEPRSESHAAISSMGRFSPTRESARRLTGAVVGPGAGWGLRGIGAVWGRWPWWRSANPQNPQNPSFEVFEGRPRPEPHPQNPQKPLGLEVLRGRGRVGL